MVDYQENGAGLLVPNHKIAVQGAYHGQLIRAGQVVDEWEDPNLVTNEGLNSLLGVYFNSASQITTWYMGLFESNSTPLATWGASNLGVASATVTETTAYTSSTRPEYVEAAPSSQSITNSASRASFVFNASKTIYGALLVSASAKNATTGVLFSAARFAAAKAVESGDELLLTYTFTASSV